MPYKIKQIIFKDQPKVSVEGQIVFERQCGMYYSGVYPKQKLLTAIRWKDMKMRMIIIAVIVVIILIAIIVPCKSTRYLSFC